MSGQQFNSPPVEPVIPRPDVTVEALRAAVERLEPEQTAKFDEEFAEFEKAAASGVGNPMRTFLRSWSFWVELYRVPATAARIHELELELARAGSGEEARMAATRMSVLLDEVSAALPWPP